jgi:hypothetical protein
MEQQIVVTQQYTILQETQKTPQIINRPIFQHVMLLRKYKEKQFLCGHNILTEGVLVTQLSSNAHQMC